MRFPALAPLTDLHAGARMRGAPYVVVRARGQGGMGEVFEAEHTELGRRVAIKVLHRRHHGRADLVARLRAEARALAKLRHRNLIEVFDLGTLDDGRPWFAMPLLHGRDLREELARVGPLPVPLAAALMAEALDGLAVAHAAGVVHRDVKLENLFLETEGTVKVLDFGVATDLVDPRVADGSGFARSPGTPRTMAPEQCAGAHVDPRADLYAAGLALYELTTGRGPFDDLRGNDHALRYAHCTRQPLPPSAVAPWSLPLAFDRIVLRALAKAPVDRFQSAAEMATELRRLRAVSDHAAEPGSSLSLACLALGLAMRGHHARGARGAHRLEAAPS